jgi:hypothetical protein
MFGMLLSTSSASTASHGAGFRSKFFWPTGNFQIAASLYRAEGRSSSCSRSTELVFVTDRQFPGHCARAYRWPGVV